MASRSALSRGRRSNAMTLDQFLLVGLNLLGLAHLGVRAWTFMHARATATHGRVR